MSVDNIIKYPADADYWLRQALVEQLEQSTRYLIGERDAMNEGCTDTDGIVHDTNDRDALAELDQLIDDNQAVIKVAADEPITPNAVVQADIANARSRGE